MRSQAEAEGSLPQSNEPAKVLGSDVVSDDDATALCMSVLKVLGELMETRDMTVNEVKLILQIEDPRQKERRRMGMEDESGVSRDEIAFAFQVSPAGGRGRPAPPPPPPPREWATPSPPPARVAPRPRLPTPALGA